VLTWEGHQQEIEDTNVLLTNLNCMKQIIENISPVPNYVLVDGLHAPKQLINKEIGIETMVKGDSLSASIAAASIVAKVTRDRQMVDLEQNYPELEPYHIGKNKGYLSAEHRQALEEHGRSPFHRKTYKYKWQNEK
jgi:ribonuclease HII